MGPEDAKLLMKLEQQLQDNPSLYDSHVQVRPPPLAAAAWRHRCRLLAPLLRRLCRLLLLLLTRSQHPSSHCTAAVHRGAAALQDGVPPARGAPGDARRLPPHRGPLVSPALLCYSVVWRAVAAAGCRNPGHQHRQGEGAAAPTRQRNERAACQLCDACQTIQWGCPHVLVPDDCSAGLTGCRMRSRGWQSRRTLPRLRACLRRQYRTTSPSPSGSSTSSEPAVQHAQQRIDWGCHACCGGNARQLAAASCCCTEAGPPATASAAAAQNCPPWLPSVPPSNCCPALLCACCPATVCPPCAGLCVRWIPRCRRAVRGGSGRCGTCVSGPSPQAACTSQVGGVVGRGAGWVGTRARGGGAEAAGAARRSQQGKLWVRRR